MIRQTMELVVVLLGVLFVAAHSTKWDFMNYIHLIVPWALIMAASALKYRGGSHSNEKGSASVYRGGDAGDWCFMLLPLCFQNAQPDVGQHYLAHVISTTCFASAFVVILVKQLRNEKPVRHNFLLRFGLPVCTSVCLQMFVEADSPNAAMLSSVLRSIISNAGCAAVFLLIVYMLPQICPKSFTLGELFIVAQCLTSVIYGLLANLIKRAESFMREEYTVKFASDVTSFNQMLLLGAIFIVIIVSVEKPEKNLPAFISAVASVGIIIVMPSLWFLLGRFPFLWLYEYIFACAVRPILIGYWFVLSATSVMIAIKCGKCYTKVTTGVRKYFHLFSIVVFVPGICFDLELTKLASGIALFIFVMMECVRVLQIPPFGAALYESFEFFRDEKDGKILLTHIYLLFGCAVPLFLSDYLTTRSACFLELLSGILAVGVGDTVASVGGSLVGRLRWPDTKKTVEGTVLAFLGQMLFSYIVIVVFEYSLPVETMWRFAAPLALVSLLEGFTQQIDNLVLPLFLFAMLRSLERAAA